MGLSKSQLTKGSEKHVTWISDSDHDKWHEGHSWKWLPAAFAFAAGFFLLTPGPWRNQSIPTKVG